MRLAVVMPARTSTPGGVQRFASELVPGLRALGAEVHEYRVHPTPAGNRPVAALKGVGALLVDHRRAHFDAVLTTFHWPPRISGLRTFGVVHDLRSCPQSLYAPARLLKVAATRTWTATFVPSEHVGQSVNSMLGPKSVIVIGEGLDHLDRYHLQPPPERSGIVVIAGRAPHKRGRLGLEAAIVATRRLGCRVTVVGRVEGDVPSDVDVLDQPDDETLARVYQSAVVAVAASSYEGFGLAAGEALRAGTPVVYAEDGTLASSSGPVVSRRNQP